MLKGLFQRKPTPAETLYGQIVAAARQPKFYADWAVPDTVDGRFDMIALHMFATLNRLKDEPGNALSQALVDVFFGDMDSSLREMGVGDLTVGKKVRKIAESFYGRMDAYRQALDDSSQTLTNAIARNVYADGDKQHAADLSQWLQHNVTFLKTQGAGEISAGRIAFHP
jgi:cytochrome b pre-mRNA-processing protein 3